MNITPRSEDYLKNIYVLSKTQEVHASHLAEAMGVSRPTVSVALKGLKNDGYITVENGRDIGLTDEGKNIAKQIYEKNVVFWKFLVGCGVEDKIARADACRLEHAVGPESFAVFKQILQDKQVLLSI